MKLFTKLDISFNENQANTILEDFYAKMRKIDYEYVELWKTINSEEESDI